MKCGISCLGVSLQIVSEDEREKQCLTSMSDISQGREQKSVDSIDSTPLDNASGNNSDDQLATVPTAKGGMRRKHHRAWSLTEVMKLVDGVAKFGAGRWSEIKRLSFSSYTHRTSVDLKVWINDCCISGHNVHIVIHGLLIVIDLHIVFFL